MRALGPTAFGCGPERPELAGADTADAGPSRNSEEQHGGGEPLNKEK
jgi:hypothetical protein